MLASIVDDDRSNQTITLVFVVFCANTVSLRYKITHWLVQSQNNMSDLSDISALTMDCLACSFSTIHTIQLGVLG